MAQRLRFLSSLRLIIFSLMIQGSLVFVLQGIAWGEKPNGERTVLSLPELIDRAIAKSPEIGEIRSDIRSAQSDLAQVQGAYYPQLETTAMIGPVEDAKEPLVVNGRITDPSPAISASTIGIFGRLDLTMTQPIYTFGKLSNRKEAATRGVKAKEFQVDERKAQVSLRVKRLYYALVLARAGVETANEAGDFFAEARRRIQRLLELGSANAREGDLFRIDAYRADSLRFKAEAEKGARVSYFALKSLIQLPPDVDFDPADKTLSMQEEGPAGLDSYIQKAAERRPEFKQLAEALAAQKSQVEAATSDRYPSVFAALKGSLADAPGREAMYNRYIRDDFNHAWIGVVGGIKWNFDFGIAKAKVDKMMAEYDKLVHTKASAEMNIPIQVASNYQENQEWREAANSYLTAANASRKWVFTSMVDFDMGVGTADEMLRAIERYGHNQGKYLESLYHYNLSMAELEYSVGVITR